MESALIFCVLVVEGWKQFKALKVANRVSDARRSRASHNATPDSRRQQLSSNRLILHCKRGREVLQEFT